MFGNKKTKLGFKEKPKTREEIQKEYAETAMDVGHKTRLLKQHQDRFEAFEKETIDLKDSIDELTRKMIDLNIAGMLLQDKKPEETKETA